MIVILNLRKNNRERFISQKRTISINESEHVNLTVQFNEILIDQNKFLSIKENQNNLNENDYDHND